MASATKLRDRAFHLARSNTSSALEIARSVPDSWFRAQALAAVARWSDDFSVGVIATESLAAADSCTDDYKRAAVAAWPIRALAERGCLREASAALSAARLRALMAEPAGSKAEALVGLLQGDWPLGARIHRQLVADLLDLQAESDHWRATRAVVNALGMLSTSDRDSAAEIAKTIADDKCRSKALARISAGGSRPREYF